VVFGGLSYFSRVVFRGNSDFSNAEFTEFSSFHGAGFGGNSVFLNVDFGRFSYFNQVEFRGDSDFTRAEFGGDSFFAGTVFGGDSIFSNAEFRGGSFFIGAGFGGCSDFRDVEFRGESSFSMAVFNKKVSFARSTLNYVYFGGTVARVIDLKETNIHEGRIQQPKDSSTFYDFTGATVGDVDIKKKDCYHDLFDHFRFYRTDFDGFDFTDYKDELGSNSQIHEFKYTPEDKSEGKGDQPDELEATYLKAKDGAKKVGDHELASEFFIKEMQYRRERYKDELEEEDLDWKHRAKLEFDRRVNWLYEMTSGYGEKPIRVILTSISVVVLFTFLYPFWGIRQTGDGTTQTLSYTLNPVELTSVIAESFYFSSVTFTTLGYGDLQPVGFSHILAMVESAAGALLIALLIFVFGRSVKW